MRKITGFILCAMMVLGACSRQEKAAQETSRYESIDTVPMLIMQVQKCSRLYTTEYKVHKIVTHSDILKLQGTLFDQQFDVPLPLGDRKVAIPMDATLKAYIDFSQFDADNVSLRGDRITITLPNPKVMLTASKIDQANIREYVSLARSHFSDAELSAYEQQGREAIIASIPELGILETARESAAKVLIPLLLQMGFSEPNVTIAFSDDVNTMNLRTLLDLSSVEK